MPLCVCQELPNCAVLLARGVRARELFVRARPICGIRLAKHRASARDFQRRGELLRQAERSRPRGKRTLVLFAESTQARLKRRRRRAQGLSAHQLRAPLLLGARARRPLVQLENE